MMQTDTFTMLNTQGMHVLYMNGCPARMIPFVPLCKSRMACAKPASATRSLPNCSRSTAMPYTATTIVAMG